MAFKKRFCYKILVPKRRIEEPAKTFIYTLEDGTILKSNKSKKQVEDDYKLTGIFTQTTNKI